MTKYEFPQMKYSEQKGLISIIVPIYNNETNLKKCLDSILYQTFTNWEAILVNDGSTDNTGKIIDEYTQKDSRFIAIHKQNQATLLARKTGLENSKGEFIANLDHDDTYNPKFLEKMYSKITETNSDFVWCKCNKPNSFNITDYNWNSDLSKNVATVITRSQGMAGYTWNKLIKRAIYAKVNFPNIFLTLGEDPVQMLQIAYHSKSAAFVPETLYFHRKGGVSAKLGRDYFVSIVKSAIVINNVLKMLFNEVIPHNVENAFYCLRCDAAPFFFILSKKERKIFEDELKPLLPGFIKHEKRLHFRMCSFLVRFFRS